MAKILLVEDDNNLREIFEMRLQAEGYETVTASDGEEALAVAIKEKPDLIIADVMMPKMSGFEMLENLRNSPDMAKTKVIMMTALGQAEDRARGEKLGVIKYLVKSQVTLEDFVRTVKEVADGPSNANNNNPGGDKDMDQGSQPTNPAPADGDAPAGGDSGADTNPISGGGDDGQMSSAQAQDSMNNQVNDAMGGSGDAAAPADGDAPAGGDDMSGTPADVPMSTPPADAGGGDAPAGADGDQAPAEGQGGTPTAPGGM